MKKRKLLTKLAAGVMAVALCVTSFNTAYAAPDGMTDYNRSPAEVEATEGVKPYTGGVYTYSSSDPLFAATKFHVFAEDEASIQTHCNGNIATKFLYQQANSGSNTIYETQLPEVSYIRKLDEYSVINFGPNTQVVFGDETNVYNKDNAEIYIDTYSSSADDTPEVKKIETSKQDDGTFRVFTEAGSADNERFINFDAEFQKLSKLSYNLAKEPTTDGVSINENVIDLDGVSGTAYINVTPNDLMNRAFIIDNTDFVNNQAIVINVDLGTLTDYTLPFTQVLFKEDGASFGTGEDKGVHTGHGNVLWNFFGRDELGQVVNYTGKLTTCSEFKGTILAPDADIWAASSNQDGNFIGREVHLGGGQTHRWDFGGTLKTYPDSYGSVQVFVTEEESGDPVENVEIYLYDKGDESGDPVARVVTDAEGKTVVIGNIPVGKEITAIVKEIPYGYTIDTDTLEKEIASATLHKIDFVVKKDTTVPDDPETGYIKVIVKDKDTGSYIKDITAVVTDINGTDISGGTPFVTDDFGTTHTQTLTITGTDADKYVVSIPNVPAGYVVPADQDVTLDDTNPNVVIFELSKTVDDTPKGAIQVRVFEQGTTTPIQNAIVSVNDSAGHVIKEVTVVTDVDGETEIVGGLPATTTYETELIGIPEGYKLDTDDSAIQSSIVVNENQTTVVTYFLVQEEPEQGYFKITVEDEDGFPVEGVTVTIKDSHDTQVGNALSTDGSGITESEKLDISENADENKYTFTISGIDPDEYEVTVTEKTEILTNANPDEVEFVVTKKVYGGLFVVVKDTDGNVVSNVEVEVKDGNNNVVSPADYKTSIGGNTANIPKLTVGETYTASVVESSLSEDYEIIAGSTGSEVVIADSFVCINLVVEKKVVTPTPKPSLVVIVKDEDGNPINDVDVNIKTGTTVKDTLTTGSEGTDGKTSVYEDVVLGDVLEVEVDESTIPTGYELVTTNPQSASFLTKELVTVTFVIKENTDTPETGSMEVVIKDKTTGEPIEGATVVIKNPDGTVKETVTTDENGKTPVIDDLEVGKTYTVETTDVPDGYDAPDAEEVPITSTQKVTVPLEVEQTTPVTPTPETGSMEVVITDKNTGEPIPNATVVIKNPDGTTKETVTTDENGKTPVIDELTVGETYTIETTTVPSGYTAPAPTTQKITGTALVTVPLEAGRDSGITSSVGSLYVIITDKNTGAPIPGATVEVLDSKGESIKTVVTDTTGSFTVTELKPDTYTVKTTKVPEGYTAPDPQTAEVKTNARTDVHLYVAKSATKDPTPGTSTNTDQVVQTGDESNVQVVSILAIIACLGIVVVSIMRKREELI